MKPIFPLFLLLVIPFVLLADKKNKKDKTNRPSITVTQSILNPTDIVPYEIPHRSQVKFIFTDVNPFLYHTYFTEAQHDAINDERRGSAGFNFYFSRQNFEIAELLFNDSLSYYNMPTNNSEVETARAKVREHEAEIEAHTEIVNRLRKNEADTQALINNLMAKLKMTTDTADSSALNVEQKTLDSRLSDIKGNLTMKSDELTKLKKELINLEAQQAGAIKKLDNSEKEAQEHFKDYQTKLNKYRSLITKLNHKIDYYEEMRQLLFSNQAFNIIADEKQKLLENYYGKNALPQDIINSGATMFNELDSIYFDMINKARQANTDGRLNTTIQNLVNYHNKIDRKGYKALFVEIRKIYNDINREAWTVLFQNTRIEDNADKILYDIILLPIANNVTANTQAKHLKYTYDVDGGVKIDLSTGLLFHLFLEDDNYTYIRVTDSTTQITKLATNNRFVPAVGMLLNIYRRSASSIKLVGNFGLGTNTTKLFYYAGGGLIFGKSERVGLNVGAVGGSVQRIAPQLANQIDKHQSFALQELQDNTVDMIATYDVGLYIGLTYNLKGKNQQLMPTSSIR